MAEESPNIAATEEKPAEAGAAPPPKPGVEAPAEGGNGKAEGEAAFEAGETVLRLQLDQFEGPFEVLLYLIRSQEIDIFDIPILQITEQYLAFLDLMQGEKLDVAGEFLVMAATLIQIKSRMLLPVEVEEEEEEVEEEDPRLELVEKLLEYRRFRDLGQALTQREAAAANTFGRLVKPRYEVVEDEEEYLEVGLYDLMKAIRRILRFVTDPAFHEVIQEGASVDEKIAFIEELLEQHQTVSWRDLRESNEGKMALVCCLLAILELCRMGRVRVHQHGPFGEIRLVAREAEAPVDEHVAVANE